MVGGFHPPVVNGYVFEKCGWLDFGHPPTHRGTGAGTQLAVGVHGLLGMLTYGVHTMYTVPHTVHTLLHTCTLMALDSNHRKSMLELERSSSSIVERFYDTSQGAKKHPQTTFKDLLFVV